LLFAFISLLVLKIKNIIDMFLLVFLSGIAVYYFYQGIIYNE